MSTPTLKGALLASICDLLLPMPGRAAVPVVEKARKQIGVTTAYDPAYRKMDDPGRDIPEEAGVCSDVGIRAFRGPKIDLQKEIHEEMK